MIIKNKQFGTILLIFYIFLMIYIYCYYYFLFIETFENGLKTKTAPPKKKLKFIYILDLNETKEKDKINMNNSALKYEKTETSKNIYKYSFYNKNYKRYMKLNGELKNYKKYIIIKDYEDTIIGSFKETRYNIDVIKTGLYHDHLIFEYTNNYNKVKCYVANDENIFYIERKRGEYLIYLYGLHIGKIKYNEEKKIYSVIVYEDYKIYLNLIGIAFIMLVNN